MNRTCTKCGLVLPATTEFFYADKTLKCGLRGMCKGCDRLRHKRYNAAHPEKVKVWKSADYQRRRECIAVYNACRYAANAEVERAQRAAYRASHRDEARARDRAYYLANRDKFRVINNERRTRERESGSHSAKDIQAQLKRQRGCCYWCSASVALDYHVDHVIPIAKHGSNGPENLVIACPACNRSKGAKMPHEFSNRLC